MDNTKYTPQYLEHQKEFGIAQERFNSNPCKKTATALSNLREKKWRVEEVYTEAYLKSETDACARDISATAKVLLGALLNKNTRIVKDRSGMLHMTSFNK